MNKVVAKAGERFGEIRSLQHKVLACTGQDQRFTTACKDRVVTVLALQVVDAAKVSDDIIPIAAKDDVPTIAAFKVVIATITPDRIVADAANNGVILFRST